jgi:hypothetical protein
MSHSQKVLQPQPFCKCCLNALLTKDKRVKTNEAISAIFAKLTPIYKIENGEICLDCYNKLIMFDAFQREINFKHSTVKRVNSGIQVKKVPLAIQDPVKKNEDPVKKVSSVPPKKFVDNREPANKFEVKPLIVSVKAVDQTMQMQIKIVASKKVVQSRNLNPVSNSTASC